MPPAPAAAPTIPVIYIRGIPKSSSLLTTSLIGTVLLVGNTKTSTVALDFSPPSFVAVNIKVIVALLVREGAINDNLVVFVPCNGTRGPATSFHWKVSLPPFGSLLELPSKITLELPFTTLSSPALTVGGKGFVGNVLTAVIVVVSLAF